MALMYLLQIELLTNYSGDKDRLANAEKFYMHLLSLSQYVSLFVISMQRLPSNTLSLFCFWGFRYRLRLEIMLLKEEFDYTIGYIGESLDTIIVTAQDMMESKDLQEILYLVLITGNFLNTVSVLDGLYLLM